MNSSSEYKVCKVLEELGILPTLERVVKVVLTAEVDQNVKLEVTFLAQDPLNVPVVKQFKVESIDGN